MNEDLHTSVKEISVSEPRLSPEEKLYVKAYLRTLSHKESHSLVSNVKHPTKNNRFYKSEAVQYHIQKQMINKLDAKGLTEDDVMNLLLQEATNRGKGSSPTARVQALSLLGKQLGMFEEKQKESTQTTFNIINYSSDKKEKDETSIIEKVEEQKNSQETSLPIVIQKY